MRNAVGALGVVCVVLAACSSNQGPPDPVPTPTPTATAGSSTFTPSVITFSDEPAKDPLQIWLDIAPHRKDLESLIAAAAGVRRGDSAACSRLAPLARVVKSDLTAAGFIEDSVGLTAIATATTEYTAAGTTCQKAATARTETLGDLTAGDVAIRTAAQQAKAIGTHI